MLAGLLVGAVIGVAPVTTYSVEANRFGGIWNVVARFPYLHDRSPVMAAASALGGGMLALFIVALDRRDRWVMLAAWAGFLVTQAANAAAWQRYYEPFALIALAVMASRMAGPAAGSREQGEPVEAPPLASAGPAALAGLLAAITWFTLRGHS